MFTIPDLSELDRLETIDAAAVGVLLIFQQERPQKRPQKGKTKGQTAVD